MDFKSIVIATAAAGFLFSCGAQKKTEETSDKFELVKFDNSGE
ncbi:MAG: hypothetical protein ACJAX0_000540, partial [Flavobacteriales bacterium]